MSEHTDPASLPRDVRAKLLMIKHALVENDIREAWHQLYSIADPEFTSTEPWAALESGFTETDEPHVVADLDSLAAELNSLRGCPATRWNTEEGRSNPGYIHVNCFTSVPTPLYCLHEIANDTGGVRVLHQLSRLRPEAMRDALLKLIAQEKENAQSRDRGHGGSAEAAAAGCDLPTGGG